MSERGNWMQTFTGGRFYPSDPRYEDIHIEDIAHGLSMTCRFGGQCDHFYSVAEHSWHVAMLCPQRDRLAGLMHDASEASISVRQAYFEAHEDDDRFWVPDSVTRGEVEKVLLL